MFTFQKCSDTGFLGFEVTPLFPVYNLSKKSPVSLNVFLESIQNFLQIPEMQKKIQYSFFGF